MKITKRIIAASAKNSSVLQQIRADKKALRERCAAIGATGDALTNDKKSTKSVSLS